MIITDRLLLEILIWTLYFIFLIGSFVLCIIGYHFSFSQSDRYVYANSYYLSALVLVSIAGIIFALRVMFG